MQFHYVMSVPCFSRNTSKWELVKISQGAVYFQQNGGAMTTKRQTNQQCRAVPVLLVSFLCFVSGFLFETSAGTKSAEAVQDFRELEYNRMQRVVDENGTLRQTFTVNEASGWTMRSEPRGTVLPYSVYIKKEHVFDEHALILETDADPLAVVIRRTEALLNHLSMIPGAPDLSALRTEFEQKKQSAAGKQGYHEICDIRRRIALTNPLLNFEDIVFVEHDPVHNPYLHMTRQYYGFHHAGQNVGGLYLLKGAFGPNPQKIDVLAAAGNPLSGGVYLSPELSYDGQTIYFAWCAGTGGGDEYAEDNCFHIYKVNVDGSGFQRLTSGPENDFDPCPLPSGRIAFISTRRSKNEFRMNLRCGAMVEDAYTLHSMKPGGSDIITLSFHETHEWHPSVDNNGMLVYTRWDYVDRASNEAHHMWRCSPDGRDARAPHGNYDLPWGERGTPYEEVPVIDGKPNAGTNPAKGGSCLHPWGEWNIRAIPASHKYIATASGHHTVAFGSLVMIDTRIEDNSMMSQVKRVTPECLFPEGERGRAFSDEIKSLSRGNGRMGDYYANCMYGTAWPLSEDYYLCNFWKTILLLDRFGNKIVLYTLEDGADDYRLGTRPIDPIPVTARRIPPAPAESNFDGEKADHPDHRKAIISIQNVYDTYPVPWPEGVVEEKKIKWLRIVQFIPKTTGGEDKPEVGGYNMATCRMSLGIVPVADDGSVYCEAPVKVPIYFQALDENRMAIQSMKSITYVHPGEKLSCVGCHEKSFHGWYAPPDLKSTPLAFRQPPSPILEEFPGHHDDPAKGAIPFNYHLLAKPALQRAGYGGAYTCYWAPRNFGSRSIPGHVGAHESEIGDDLVNKYRSGSINSEDFYRIVMWIDLNSNELGWDRDVDAQKAGQVVWPEISDVDPNNPIPVETGYPDPADPWQTTATRWGENVDRPEGVDPAITSVEEIRITVQDGICRVSHPRNDPVIISLYDCRGSMAVATVSNRNTGRGSIDLSNLSRGMYVLNVKTGQGVARSRMISWSR